MDQPFRLQCTPETRTNTQDSVQPHDYAMNLQAMTKEKLQFLLPVVFTVGPDVNQRGANAKAALHGPHAGLLTGHDDHHAASSVTDGSDQRREDLGDSLMKYAMLLADSGHNGKRSGRSDGGATHQFLENIVKGIIEGETRVLVSSMTMEEIFTEREVFKRRIFRNIQGELDQFGLKIYNANVKELKDAPNSVYFESLSRKAHEGATNQARIDVADAQLKGNVGEAQRKGEQDREIAKINAETAVQKTERDIERAQALAQLATKKTALDRDVDIARITAARATEERDEDLKREVEIKRAAAELERLRASDVVKAAIAREAKQQAADAKAYEIAADAKAQLERSQRQTDAEAYKTRIDAEARSAAAVRNAEADFIKKRKEADGLLAMAEGYASLAKAFGGPQGLIQYMMVESGTYVELARANAAAIQGLQPKISIWNTGSQAGVEGGSGGGQGASIETMRNVYQMLPPLMTTINEQTGITLPEWQFGRMASDASRIEREKGSLVDGKK